MANLDALTGFSYTPNLMARTKKSGALSPWAQKRAWRCGFRHSTDGCGVRTITWCSTRKSRSPLNCRRVAGSAVRPFLRVPLSSVQLPECLRCGQLAC